MKKKYYLYAILVLVVAFIAYNYYSASQAEENITKLIQQQVDAPVEAISIQYASVDVSPFAGNISFEQVNVIQPQTIKRAKKLTLDLSYYDFLLFNFGGIKYGLKHLSEVQMYLTDATFLNRKTRMNVDAEHLFIRYSGGLWEGIQVQFTPKTLNAVHKITVTGRGLAFEKPQSNIGKFKADSVFIEHTFAAKAALETEPLNKVSLTNIVWQMPQRMQQKYAFFIRGFGLNIDSIAVNKMSFSYLVDPAEVEITDGTFRAKLLDASFHGTVDKQPIARFTPLYITVTELSPKLEKVLKGLKQLFDIPISLKDNGIGFRLTGPVNSPNVVLQPRE